MRAVSRRHFLTVSAAGLGLAACGNGVGGRGAATIDARVNETRDYLRSTYPGTQELASKSFGSRIPTSATPNQVKDEQDSPEQDDDRQQSDLRLQTANPLPQLLVVLQVRVEIVSEFVQVADRGTSEIVRVVVIVVIVPVVERRRFVAVVVVRR